MLIEWVNHASFIVQSGSVRLICDPWIEGSAFNEGWHLLSPTSLKYEDFGSITHIWFSHEHPDHFSPGNLRKIPQELRKRIKVLFHATKDQRVVRLCQSLGFQTQELPSLQRVKISEDFHIVSGAQGLLDSWSAIVAGGTTLLNMNDCVFESLPEFEAVQRAIGRVDVLLSQFSYADWIGNPEDLESHRRCAERKLSQMATQIRFFQPAHFIPFASFIYFSHAENSFMNAAMNQIGDVFAFVDAQLRAPAVVLYPGDVWEVGKPYDSSESIQKYNIDLARAVHSQPQPTSSISMEGLSAAAGVFFKKCGSKNNRLLLRAMPAAVVRLGDLGVDVELSFRSGLRQVHGKQIDITLASDSLLNCLTTDWGGETLLINGRFRVAPSGNPRRFFWIFRVPRHNSFGRSLDFGFMARQAVGKTRSAVGRRLRKLTSRPRSSAPIELRAARPRLTGS